MQAGLYVDSQVVRKTGMLAGRQAGKKESR